MPLTRDEIIRELKRYRWDPEFRGEKRIPIKPLAEYMGFSRQMMYDIMSRHRRIGKGSIAKVEATILDIREGRLRFKYIKRQWVPITTTFAEKPDGGYGAPQQGQQDAKPHLALLEPKVSAYLRRLR